jgi:metallo-beta-lactamase family protein
MKISFHGAARTVTGSKHILHVQNKKKILLDCGMFQGMGKETSILNNDWGFVPAEIDYVIVSHAHIDHIGLLPKLVKEGYKGKIYCTPATASLAKLLLIDSARIQEDDLRYVNKRRSKEHKPLFEPLYNQEDAEKVFPLFETIPYNEHYKIDSGIDVMFTDCGHILGSAAVNLKIRENGKDVCLAFSGDVGRYHDMILRSPATFPQADYIILESTYGNRLHELAVTSGDRLLKHITNTCLDKKGKLIIPAFSMGRTQEILFMLNRLELERRLPPLTYYVDSPLSIKITDAVKRYPDYYNTEVQQLLNKDEDVFDFKGLKYIETVEDSIKLNDLEEPCVIISASGMAEAGRVKHHIANNISDSRNTILFTGYCEPQSLGGRLKKNPETVKIFSREFPVKAEIQEIATLSAHGDYNDLCQWLACQHPGSVKELFLVHGDYEAQIEFRERLIKKGFQNVTIPSLHQTIGLGN